MTGTRVDEVLNLSWPLPIWATVILSVLVAIGVAGLYLSERGRASRSVRVVLASLRILLLALVLWMIAGWSWLRFKTDTPELVIVLDRSASMATTDANPLSTTTKSQQSAGPQSRFQRAVEILSRLSSREARLLEQRYQLRWMTIAQSASSIDVDAASLARGLESISPDGEQSRLGDALTALLQRQVGRPTAAIVLLSDGITTSGSSLLEAANKARMMGVPIHTVAIGQESARPDVRLADLMFDDAVFLGDEVNLQVTLVGTDVGNAATQVTLKNSTTAELLDTAKVQFTGQQNQQQLTLRFIPKQIGEVNIQLEAARIPGESNIDNNSIERTVNVRDQSIRVLLVQRAPSFEFRFLKNLLKRTTQPGNAEAAAFELNVVLQESDANFAEQDDTAIRLVPSDRQTLSKYDVFLFGEFDPALVSRSSQNAIVEQVSSAGSGLMLIAGRDSSVASLQGWPLTSILPVELQESGGIPSGSDPAQRFIWQTTALGQSALPLQLATSESQNAELWRQLPGPEWVARLGAIKPAAQVLAAARPVAPATGNGPPLLVSHFAGAGRVVFQATDETYRWMGFGGSDLYYQRYWIQMIRWLSRGRLARADDSSQLIVEPRRTNVGEPIRITARLSTSDAALAGSECRVRLEQLEGRQSTSVLAQVRGTASQFQIAKADLPPGSYRAVLSEPALAEPPSANFTIIAPPGEQANLKVDRAALKAVAERTRGKFYLAEQADELFQDLPPGTAVRLGSLPPKPIWNSPWVALVFVLLITTEWILRRACRMF